MFRAGFGIFTVPSLGWEAYMMTGVAVTDAPFYVNSITNGVPLFKLPAAGYGNGGLTPAVVGSFNVFEAQDIHYRDPASAQWNVTIERELWKNWTARGSYIGGSESMSCEPRWTLHQTLSAVQFNRFDGKPGIRELSGHGTAARSPFFWRILFTGYV